MESNNPRHLHALRSFVSNLVEQAERSGKCDCHKPPSLLLVGPPGTGKTYLVKQMSQVCEMPLFGVHTNKISHRKDIRKIFNDGREAFPSLVFLDDIESIFVDQTVQKEKWDPNVKALREELFLQLGQRKLRIFDKNSRINPTNHGVQSTKMNGNVMGPRSMPHHSRPTAPSHHHLHEDDDDEDYDDFEEDDEHFLDNNGIIVVAATSKPWLMYNDHELLSRYRGVYLVGLPDKQTRFNQLKMLLNEVKHSLTDRDIMIVAEKTEGYTPADLTVIVKTLAFNQLAVLFNLESADEGSSHYASQVASDNENDTRVPHVSSTSAAAATGMIAAAAGAALAKRNQDNSQNSNSRPSPTVPYTNGTRQKDTSRPKTTAAAQAAAAALMLEEDWTSSDDDYDQEEMLSARLNDMQRQGRPTRLLEESVNEQPQSPKSTGAISKISDTSSVPQESKKTPSERDSTLAVPHVTVPSPDSAIELSKSSEEIGKVGPDFAMLTPDSASSTTSGIVSSVCDSSDSSAIVDDDNSLKKEHVSSVKETPTKDNSGESEKRTVESDHENINLDECGEVFEEEVNVDTIEVNDINHASNNSSRVGTPAEFELHYEEPPDPMRNDNNAVDSDSDNDISTTRSRPRRVGFSGLNSMEPLSIDVGDMPPNVSISDIPGNNLSNNMNSDHLNDESTNAILRSLLARPSTINNLADSQSDNEDMNVMDDSGGAMGGGVMRNYNDRSRKSSNRQKNTNRELALEGLAAELATMAPIVGCDVRGNKSSSPIQGGMDPLLVPNSQLTPTPSDSSSCAGTIGSSGSGTRASNNHSGSETRKKSDSESSYEHSEGRNNRSDVSTATCNETSETLECGTDCDERLQGLESGGDRDNDDDDDTTTDTIDGSDGRLQSLLNIDMDDIQDAIKVITIMEVLQVVNQTCRSVSEEETKKYTDFMEWFAEVAKTACTHGNSDKKGGADNFDDISLDSSRCDTASLSKKRKKKPLRSLGRFLLKALMFILD